MKVFLKILSNVDENLALKLLYLDALFVAQVNINDIILFVLIVSKMNWQVWLGSVLYFCILQTLVVLVLTIRLLYVLDITLTLNFRFFRLL